MKLRSDPSTFVKCVYLLLVFIEVMLFLCARTEDGSTNADFRAAVLNC